MRLLTDAAGAVTDTYDYDAFGNLLNSTGLTPNEFRFAGEQFDFDLGLYYNRARHLNTSTGRFWTMDASEGTPVARTSLHKYLYANGPTCHSTTRPSSAPAPRASAGPRREPQGDQRRREGSSSSNGTRSPESAGAPPTPPDIAATAMKQVHEIT